jgi:hypothetical protein
MKNVEGRTGSDFVRQVGQSDGSDLAGAGCGAPRHERRSWYDRVVVLQSEQGLR